MIPIEKRWMFQQTDLGKVSNQVAEDLRTQLEQRCKIPKNTIKSGRIEALFNERTGERKYYER